MEISRVNRTGGDLRYRAAPHERGRPGHDVHVRLRDVVALKHREPGHRAPALCEEEIEQRIFRVGEHGGLLRQRDLDHALPAHLEHVGVRSEFFAACALARQRPSAVADVLVEHARREAECTGVEGFRQQPLICAVSDGEASRSIDCSPMTQWRNGVSGAKKPRLMA
jgi:hypothetical protein